MQSKLRYLGKGFFLTKNISKCYTLTFDTRFFLATGGMGTASFTESDWFPDFCSTFGWEWDLVLDFWNITGDLKFDEADTESDEESEKSMPI